VCDPCCAWEAAGPERPNLDDCYFERLTNCTLADVTMSANSSDARARLIDIQHGELADLKVRHHRSVCVMVRMLQRNARH
jgi:hypothetical protein